MGETGWKRWKATRGTPETELLESQLRVREDRTATAGLKVRDLWHDLASYEQDLADDLDRLQHEYSTQPDLDAEDAAAALRRELTPTIQQMADAVDTVQQYFRDEGIVEKPHDWEYRMTNTAANTTYDGYNGKTAGEIVDRIKEKALAYRDQLNAARDRVEDVKRVQTDLPAYLRGDTTFDPVTVEDTITPGPDPADDNKYSQTELATALMEAYGRHLKDELGSYAAADERVQAMVNEDMAGWVDN